MSLQDLAAIEALKARGYTFACCAVCRGSGLQYSDNRIIRWRQALSGPDTCFTCRGNGYLMDPPAGQPALDTPTPAEPRSAAGQ